MSRSTTAICRLRSRSIRFPHAEPPETRRLLRYGSSWRTWQVNLRSPSPITKRGTPDCATRHGQIIVSLRVCYLLQRR